MMRILVMSLFLLVGFTLTATAQDAKPPQWDAKKIEMRQKKLVRELGFTEEEAVAVVEAEVVMRSKHREINASGIEGKEKWSQMKAAKEARLEQVKAAVSAEKVAAYEEMLEAAMAEAKAKRATKSDMPQKEGKAKKKKN